MEYVICQECPNYCKSIRSCLCMHDVSTNKEYVIAGNTDGGVAVWVRTSNVDAFDMYRYFNVHVGNIFVLIESEKLWGQCEGNYTDTHAYYSGGRDNMIFLTTLEGAKLKQYQGHENSICSLSVIPKQELLVSGSWDGTARVWQADNQSCLHILRGHLHAVYVLPVLACSESSLQLITGSADKAIRLWDNNACIKTRREAHSDVIRKIIELPSTYVGAESVCQPNQVKDQATLSETQTRPFLFMTCSNDQTVNIWNLDLDLLKTFNPHSSFIYDVALNPSVKKCVFITASEDKCVKVWDMLKNEMLCMLNHPETVWQVGCLTNGDMVTISEDKYLRVWSLDKSRAIVPNVELTSKTAKPQESNDIDISKLIGIEELNSVAGKREGQTKIVRDGASAIAYTWNDGEWNRVGTVVGTDNSNKTPSAESSMLSINNSNAIIQSKYYTGDQYFPSGSYDYLFDVETSGKYTKLPFNVADDVLITAEKFCARESINKSHIKEIMEFIRTNTIAIDSKSTLVQTPSKLNTFTSKYFPQYLPKQYNKLPDLDNMEKKLLDNNSEIEATYKTDDETQEKKSLSPEEIAYLYEIFRKLRTDNWLRSDFRVSEQLLVFDKLAKWDSEYIFPVIDLWRILVLNENATTYRRYYQCDENDLLIRALNELQKYTSTPVVICCVRFLTNMFFLPSSRKVMLKNYSPILSALSHISQRNDVPKSVRCGIAFIIFNYTISINEDKHNIHKDLRLQIYQMIVEMLKTSCDLEFILNTCIALGSLLALKNLQSDEDRIMCISLYESCPNNLSVVEAILADILSKIDNYGDDNLKPSVKECISDLMLCVGYVVS